MPGEAREPALESFDALVGEWAIEMKPSQHVSEPTPGRMTIEWLRGERVMVQRSKAEDPVFPESVAVFMADDESGSLAMHYFDSRGVARVYRTSFEDGLWKIWRSARGPGDFDQRFDGRLSDDGTTIEASWSKTGSDGSWELDFELTYTRAG